MSDRCKRLQQSREALAQIINANHVNRAETGTLTELKQLQGFFFVPRASLRTKK